MHFNNYYTFSECQKSVLENTQISEFMNCNTMHKMLLGLTEPDPVPLHLLCRVGVPQVLWSPEPPPTPPPAAVTAVMSPPAAASPAWTAGAALPCLGSLQAHETLSHSTHTPRRSHRSPGE